MREIMDRLKRPFKAEVKSGYLNTAVFGGFDQYILNHLDQLKRQMLNAAPDLLPLVGQIRLIFLDYKRILPEERQEVIRKVIPMIQELDQEIEQVLRQQICERKACEEKQVSVGEQSLGSTDHHRVTVKKDNVAEAEELDNGLSEVDDDQDGKDGTADFLLDHVDDLSGDGKDTRKKAKVHQTPLMEIPALDQSEVQSTQSKKLAELPEHKEKSEVEVPDEAPQKNLQEVPTDIQINFSEVSDLPDPLAILDKLEELAGSIQYIKGIGPKRAQVLQRVDVENIMDLLYYIPREYSDRSEVIPISDLTELDFEHEITIVGKVVSVQEVRPRRGIKIVKVGIHDGTGLAFGVWFNQPYIKNQFKNGDKVIFSGKVNQKNYNRFRKIELSNPIYENLNMEEHVHTRRIVPIYPLTDGLNQKNVREMIKNTIDGYLKKMPDLVPESIRQKFGLFSIEDALHFIHFPENKALLDEAKRRLIFEDFFLLQLGILFQRESTQSDQESYSCKEDQALLQAFLKLLPFTLTNAQKRVWEDISGDLKKNRPMYRLLQGDVGSGKTVIAAMTLMKGIENGLQGALMAPTEILAEQHYLSLENWFEALDLHVALITGSLKKKAREEILIRLKDGEIDLLIGTHALIQEWVEFQKLGVVVIDEQHRFGVKQRESLRNKGEIQPHVLVMTATPIPRSMALTIYGDLDLSIIDELPPGRKPIKTVWRGPEARDKIYDFIKEQLDEGRQAYVVCPLIDESDVMDVESATQMAEYLAEQVFNEYRVGLLTGQTQKDEREATMQAFRAGEMDILVSTTVIEVGVDVPNANIMLIEDAQRFGLAQLHQLRGRVGRGQAQSYCVLIGNATTSEGERRLNVMVETNDGFRIAEEDLAIRGPGEFFGTRQHGLPEFKVANLIRDWEVLETVREEVQTLLKEKPDWIPNELLRIILAMRFKGSFLTEDAEDETIK